MADFIDFTYDEIRAILAETFNYEEAQLLHIDQCFHHLNKCRGYSGVYADFSSARYSCIVSLTRGLHTIRDENNCLIFAQRTHALGLSPEQLELFKCLGCRIIQRAGSFVIIGKSMFSGYTIENSDKCFIVVEDFDEWSCRSRSVMNWFEPEIVDPTWSLDQTIQYLRTKPIVDQHKLNQFQFERELQAVSQALLATEAQENLVAIALYNVLDQGQLLQYRENTQIASGS